jgi:hypothetical protein
MSAWIHPVVKSVNLQRIGLRNQGDFGSSPDGDVLGSL